MKSGVSLGAEDDMPEKVKMVPLGAILSREQIEAAVRILRSTTDNLEQTRRLKEYLKPFEAELLAKGVVYEYLAYVLLAMKDKLLAVANQDNLN